jgi:hypothetical protein
MANRIYSLRLEAFLQNSYIETVLHFQSTGTADNDTLAAAESLCNGWNTSIKSLWLATLPSAYFVYRLSSRRVDLKPSATGHKYLLQGTAVGTRGTDATALQTCPSVFLIPTMGTSTGGKIFWPAIPQGDLVDSVSSVSWQTVVDSCIAAMISGFTNSGITWTLCIYSRKHNTASNVVGHTYSPFVGFQVGRRGPSEVRSRRAKAPHAP